MADFSFLSESDESAVEDLVSQAIDLSVLEQIATINCSGSSESVLPTDLETRFRKLKSFPGANPKLKTPPPCYNQEKKEIPTSLNRYPKTPISSSDEESDLQSHFPKILAEKSEINSKNWSKPSTDLSSGEEELPNRKGSKPKSRTATVSSPSISSGSSSEASSPPPRQNCCFWCSPKRVSRKKSRKKYRMTGIGVDTLDWGKNDEILSDLSTYSVKEQQRKLKKALKEEEKISREAEKVVEWAKQASARMNVSVIQDVLSDDERFKKS